MTFRTRVLVIMGIAVGAYVGAAWLIGLDVQSQLVRREQLALTRSPYVVLIHREYHRGVLGATEQLTYGLRGPFARFTRLLPAADSPATEPTIQITVRNVIHYGPLPGFRSVGLAVVDTEVLPPSGTVFRWGDAFGGRPMVTGRTRLSWSGGATASFSVPAFRVPLQGGAVLTSSRVSFYGETTRDEASSQAHGVWAGFSIQSPLARVAFGGIDFDADLTRLRDPLYGGDVRIRIAAIQSQGGKGALLRVNGLAITGKSTGHGDYFDTGLDVTARDVNIARLSLSHVEYAFRLDHLQMAALASLAEALRTAQANAAPGAPAADLAAVQAAFVRYGSELLAHDPVLEIPRIGFRMPEGELLLQAKLAAHGIPRGDLAGIAAIAALAAHLDATADLRIDAALLAKLLSSSPRGAALAAQIDALQRQGYLKRDGAAWTMQLAYRAGKLTINGVAYPPAPTL